MKEVIVMNKYKKIFIISFLIVLSISILGMKKNTVTAKNVYRVYLGGKSIGLIKSKSDLEKYIDKEQESLKKKYGVNKVYAPADLDIQKEITYSNNISSTKEIYEKIKDISPFTIKGYTITIKPTNTSSSTVKDVDTTTKKIYVLDKKVFENAVDKSVRSFVNEEDYEVYKNNKKQVIKDTGKIIEKIYIENNILIKKQNIPVNEKIYLTVEDLSKYLLFGATKSQQKYTIKDGDTIPEISYNNKMSSDEFLIINTQFKDENALLYTGQEVNIGILNPQFNIVQEEEVVELQEKKYATEIKYDNSKLVGYEAKEQEGVNGTNKITQKVRKINGETTNIVTTSTEVITPVKNEIIIKGGQKSSYTGGRYGTAVATKGSWGWPASCSSVSSQYGYRWGALHDGTDIAGCGYGSNIFAAQSGTVVVSARKNGGYAGGYGDNGEYIIIDHHNGYYTIYAHLCPGCRYVKTGDTVQKGQVIGGMGKTGAATGVHLHFGLWQGYPYRGGRSLNAMSVY